MKKFLQIVILTAILSIMMVRTVAQKKDTMYCTTTEVGLRTHDAVAVTTVNQVGEVVYLNYSYPQWTNPRIDEGTIFRVIYTSHDPCVWQKADIRIIKPRDLKLITTISKPITVEWHKYKPIRLQFPVFTWIHQA